MNLFWMLFFSLSLVLEQPARANIDLDQDFLKATSRTISANPKESFFLNSVTPGWDGSNGFPGIVKQSPFGACQSFSMTAMMEYLFFHETGRVIKLSEKYTARSLLDLMIEDLWNKEKNSYELKPELGLGIAPYMIETVSKFGLLPNADYPWGDYSSEVGSTFMDKVTYETVFENPKRDYSHEEYVSKVQEVFLSEPPRKIRYSYKYFNFETGKEETILLKSPTELAETARIEKNRFLILNNVEMNPTFNPQTENQRKEMLDFFTNTAEHFKTPQKLATKQEIQSAIQESLERRMVVLVASDIWIGSFSDRLVYQLGGGHAMVIVGYQIRDGETYYKLRNSWGPGIGVDGYNYIKASTFLPNIYYVVTFR